MNSNEPLRIGVDVDGVLADFNTNFIQRCIDVTGRDLFPERPFDIPTWNYPEHYGYTAAEVSATWDSIKTDPAFWGSLPPLLGAMGCLEWLRELSQTGQIDLYFVTARLGVMAKQQTEMWLATHSGDFMWAPTVLIASDKGTVARGLKLTHYIDDRWENADAVAYMSLNTKVYLRDQPWNEKPVRNGYRIFGLDEFQQLVDIDLRKV